jgi:heme/copper-type cytochrome/quinol oxidase subunit 2
MERIRQFITANFIRLAFCFAALLVIFLPMPGLAAPVERIIRVEANNYAYAPSVMSVNPGDRVTIELVAKDVAHGLTIDGYPVDLHADPGQTARVTFVADRAGTFKLRCSIACGNLHPFMTGKFVVGPNLLFIRALGLALLAFAFGIVHLSSRKSASVA